jgi:hypothetical protein
MLIEHPRRETTIQSGLMDTHTRTFTGAPTPIISVSAIPEDNKSADIKPKNKGGRPKKNITEMPEKDNVPDKVEKTKKSKK